MVKLDEVLSLVIYIILSFLTCYKNFLLWDIKSLGSIELYFP